MLEILLTKEKKFLKNLKNIYIKGMIYLSIQG